MKILLTTSIFPPDIGGPATYVDKLAEKLAPNHQVEVVTFSDQKISDRPFKVYKVGIKGNSILRQWHLFRTVYRQAKNVDIIYSQGAMVVGLMSVLVGKLLKKKIIIKFVGDEVWERAQTDKIFPVSLKTFYHKSPAGGYKFLSWLQKLSMQLTIQIITPSKELKRFLINIYGISAAKISVIPNAAEGQIFKAAKIKNQLIFAGRLVPWKYVGDIIRAVALAQRKNPWRLVIVGKGPEKKRLIQLSKNLQVNWVYFAGALSHKQTLRKISQSQILLLYSSYEGLPHVLIEAMLSKTAIVASDISINREVLENGKLGRLVGLSEPEALAEAIIKGCTRGMIDKAEEIAKQKYSWDNHLRLLLKIMSVQRRK
ncbi:hypothetical protein A2160_02780 [Candidatus Beckwithbacteria bacterium RBG_13_42_9]|uniref:Glycosyltransferase subfamily 4-like N-terminal domain-containing protein n=1 Tax=Candidatus Beckwithbacteria bacterium RBG_13_42_9 TaxID=1797457 RepID=A0A1F5E7N1_9BACT|nr:MAG: hypothetical protein A2160_02780 [Candidatus Beckwithbacteria bacterium RBG_13_42_9]